MNRLSSAWRSQFGPGAMREHHLIPQQMLADADFVQQMKAAGITNPRDFLDRQIARIPNAEHIRIHANRYNAEWRDWFKANRNFSKKDLQAQIRFAMRKHSIAKSARRGPRYGCG